MCQKPGLVLVDLEYQPFLNPGELTFQRIDPVGRPALQGAIAMRGNNAADCLVACNQGLPSWTSELAGWSK
jgi:hypothetical protein